MAQQTNAMFTNIIDHKRKIATELTGKSQVTPNRGNKYLFVLYEYGSNIILFQTTKANKEKKFIWLFKDLHENLINRGLNPTYMILENKASPALQRHFKPRASNYISTHQECIAATRLRVQSKLSKII